MKHNYPTTICVDLRCFPLWHIICNTFFLNFTTQLQEYVFLQLLVPLAVTKHDTSITTNIFLLSQ